MKLSCHSPQVPDSEDFEDWVFIATFGFHIRVPPQFKDDFVDRIRRSGHVMLPSDHHTTVVRSNPTITLSLLIKILHVIHCDKFRINGYGMKTPYHQLGWNMGIETDPEDIKYLSFDIG